MAKPGGKRRETGSRLYGPHQSRFTHSLERRERERRDPVARELRRRPGRGQMFVALQRLFAVLLDQTPMMRANVSPGTTTERQRAPPCSKAAQRG